MEPLSFKSIFNKYNYRVEIPMLQRDYAYGRNSEKEKRIEFLKKLKDYLLNDDNNIQYELDFIYGTIVLNNTLILLDGQQRVTTLFLLYWYLSLISGNYKKFQRFILDRENKSKFTYKTRYSSTQFCNKLTNLNENFLNKNTIESLEKNNKKISYKIKNEKWFFSHWLNDPTIINMLNMLDSIFDIFKYKDSKDFYDRLENNKIVFNFLNLEDFKLTDELYIKMNSRGRSLTRFENLKTKLLQEYSKLDQTDQGKQFIDKINVKGNKHFNSLREYFSLMIDTKWLDVFWNFKKEKTENLNAKDIDNNILNFISVVAINLSVLFDKKEEKEIKELMEYKNKIPYEKLINLFKCKDDNKVPILLHLITIFDAITEKNSNILKEYFKNDDKFFYYTEKTIFDEIIDDDKKTDFNYEIKVKFWGYIYYLINNKNIDIELFKDWMRFVCNICCNSNVSNSEKEFCNAIKGLKILYHKKINESLSEKEINIEKKEIKNDEIKKLPTLDKSQIYEEILKAKLYKKDDRWKTIILQYSKDLEYFEGRLYYPLIELCKINPEIKYDAQINFFEKEINKLKLIFSSKTGCNCEKELILALLSKGDYTIESNFNMSLLQNNGRDISWKKFLKDSKKKIYFTQVLKDLDIYTGKTYEKNNNAINQYLKEILEKGEKNINNYNWWWSWWWRICFVKNSNILQELGKDRYLRFNNNNNTYLKGQIEIDLLKKTRISGSHSEIFSLCKYYELKQKKFNIKPFNKIEYKYTSSEKEQPFTYLKEWKNYRLAIYYQGNSKFCLKFYAFNKNYIEIEENTKIILEEKHNFKKENINDSPDYFVKYDIKEEDLIFVLSNICESLKNGNIE